MRIEELNLYSITAISKFTLTWLNQGTWIWICNFIHIILLIFRHQNKIKLLKFYIYPGSGAFRRGEGALWSSQNSKCQDLPKFQLEGGYSGVVKTQSAKICLNFNFRGRGYSGVVKTQSAKICLNFNFQGRGLSDLKFQRGALWRIWTKIYCLRSTVQKPACASQIVSHILRMLRLINP